MAWRPLRNIGLKIAALGVSTLLWFTISGQQVERSVSVPVFYRSLPEGLQLTGDRVEQVAVHLKGGYTQMSQLGREEVKLVIDLGGARPGQNVLTLRTDQVEAPLGIEVTQVDPATLAVVLERSGALSLPVVPAVEGQPAPGYALGGVKVEPATVVVVGPISRLKDTPSVTTETISVEGATAAVTKTVNVAVTDAELRLAEIKAVRVTVTIVRKSAGG